ncbi:MAG: hypothetical protein V9E83_13865 [Baekduia sp.]
MSNEPQSNVPPVGEEIHLPPGSLQPLALTFGLTVFLVALTHWLWVSAIGLIIVIAAIALWIRDARDEYRHLPADHGHAHEPVPGENEPNEHAEVVGAEDL